MIPTSRRPTSAEVDASAPLAERMRPRTLDEFVGQAVAGRRRPSAAPGDRAGPPPVDHPVGAAGHRQDHPRPADRDRYQGALHRVQRGAVGDQGDPQRDGGSRRDPPPDRPAHDPLHRRDPPFQQGPAGCVSPPRRSGRHRAHRGDDREPVVRGELGAALAVQGPRAEGARAARDRRNPATGAGRQRAWPR